MKVQAYIDLSFIVFLFNVILSFIYSLILFDSYKYNLKFIITFILSIIIIGLLNMFLIPYLLIFYLIIIGLIYLLIDIKKSKVIFISLIIYYINNAFLVLIGGCFIYNGFLYISTPFVSIFVLFIPFYISLIHIISSLLYKRLKYYKFKFKCKLIINNITYKELGYYDTGNSLTYNDIPVIFLKGKLYFNEGIKINIKGINDITYTYIAYKGKLLINKKIKDVYVVFVKSSLNFYNCNILLNKYVL